MTIRTTTSTLPDFENSNDPIKQYQKFATIFNISDGWLQSNTKTHTLRTWKITIPSIGAYASIPFFTEVGYSGSIYKKMFHRLFPGYEETIRLGDY